MTKSDDRDDALQQHLRNVEEWKAGFLPGETMKERLRREQQERRNWLDWQQGQTMKATLLALLVIGSMAHLVVDNDRAFVAAIICTPVLAVLAGWALFGRR